MIPNLKHCFEYNPDKDPTIGLNEDEMFEAAMNYMELWYNDESPDEFKAMHDDGDYESCAEFLCDSGAIDSSSCYENCKNIEIFIESLGAK